MSTHDQDARQQHLGTKIRFVLSQFEGCTIDPGLLVKMAETLNEELAAWLDGRRIQLFKEGTGIRVAVEPEPGAGDTSELSREARSGDAGLAGFEAVKAALAA